jgi:exodeoxyribonuclease VII, small subunit
MTTKVTEGFDFEGSLKELEALVEGMEQGSLTLEESLMRFERGIELTRRCQEALKAAEQKVEMLIEKGGQPQTVPFDRDGL